MAKALGLDITKKADKSKVSLLKGWLGMGSLPIEGGSGGCPTCTTSAPSRFKNGTSLAMRRRCDRAATDDPAAKRASVGAEFGATA